MSYKNQNAVMPPRPPMPTRDDDYRAKHQRSRAAILRENFDSILQAWLTNYVLEEVLETWGQPDTSANPLVSYCRQLTTPGRYYKRPQVMHADAEAKGLIGPGGKLDMAGLFSKLQTVEYLNTGLGDYFVRLDVHGEDLTIRLVDPSNIYVERDPDTLRTVLLWELRPRHLHPEGRIVWTWDAYFLGDERRGLAPYYRILSAEKSDEGEYEDLSHRFLRSEVNGVESFGALVGEAYPFRSASGAPFLPWVQYTSADTGETWHWTELRGLHRGTLHVCSYATYTGRAALDATGSHAIAYGLEPPAVDVRASSGGPYDVIGNPSGAPVRQMSITPGTITFCETTGGVQPGVSLIGPGINLDSLQKFTRAYIHDLMAHRGVGGGMSVEKTGANPASGAALYISDRQRREHQERTEPLYRRYDLELISKAAMLCNLAHGSYYPESGYTIVYPRPERSPQEEKDTREASNWAVENGYMSKAQVFMSQNPGISYDEAVEELVRVGLEEQAIERRAAERGAEIVAELAADRGEEAVEGEGIVVAPEDQQFSIEATSEKVVLNGAQVTAAQGIVGAVARGELPRATGVSMLIEFFGIGYEAAEGIMGEVGRGFTPRTDEPTA